MPLQFSILFTTVVSFGARVTPQASFTTGKVMPSTVAAETHCTVVPVVAVVMVKSSERWILMVWETVESLPQTSVTV